jgi:hypothetical protein
MLFSQHTGIGLVMVSAGTLFFGSFTLSLACLGGVQAED